MDEQRWLAYRWFVVADLVAWVMTTGGDDTEDGPDHPGIGRCKRLNTQSIILWTMSQKQVTARVPEDLYEAIETIREEEQTDRSTAIKRLLERGIENWQLETAVRRYQDGTVSLGRAAELADVSVWRMLDVLGERGVDVNYTEADLEADRDAVHSG